MTGDMILQIFSLEKSCLASTRLGDFKFGHALCLSCALLFSQLCVTLKIINVYASLLK